MMPNAPCRNALYTNMALDIPYSRIVRRPRSTAAASPAREIQSALGCNAYPSLARGRGPASRLSGSAADAVCGVRRRIMVREGERIVIGDVAGEAAQDTVPTITAAGAQAVFERPT